jgi:hypothetical protein
LVLPVDNRKGDNQKRCKELFHMASKLQKKIYFDLMFAIGSTFIGLKFIPAQKNQLK